tara:strand:- start:3651 stop:5486 length:1836 start_codon:yes stop_codon:yes gene_type:complete
MVIGHFSILKYLNSKKKFPKKQSTFRIKQIIKKMNNQNLAKIFTTFTHICEIRGDKNDFFRVRSYQKVVQILENLDKDIVEYLDKNKEKFKENIPGIGKESAKKIIEYINTGKVTELEESKKTIPDGLLEMLEIKNLGPKKVKKFWTELNVTNIEKLKQSILDGKIEKLSGMGQKSAQKILEGIEILNLYNQRKPLVEIYFDIQEILQEVQSHPLVIKADIAGSFRRHKETVGDIDLLVACKQENREKFIQDYLKMDFLEKIENQGDTKVTAYLKLGLQIDLRLVEEDQFGAAMQYFTGNQTHNINLRTRAKQMGMKINEYGLFKSENNQLIASKTEKEIYKALNLDYVPAYLRGGTDEIILAEKSELPKVIELKDIKGDCHMHSTYSDGKNTIQEMAQKAKELNYEYIVITDHSQSLKIANGLTPERLFEKAKETQKLNSENIGVKIFHGSEVDILKDGSLDYKDEVLENLDFIVASVHSKFDESCEERYLKVIENPYVNVIGHMTTQEYGSRKPLELDYDKIFAKAAKHNVAIEINCSARRNDIPSDLIPLALKHGCKFFLNTDSHSTQQLLNMQIGVNLLKSARVKKEDILNTYSLEEFKKYLKNKKG